MTNAVEVLKGLIDHSLGPDMKQRPGTEALSRIERLVEASNRLAPWMAAALSDPTVCAEMKLAAALFIERHAAVLGEEG